MPWAVTINPWRLNAAQLVTAVWHPRRDGCRVRPAGIHPGTQKVLLHGAAGYTDTVPIAKALDGTGFIVYEMNGQPLLRAVAVPAGHHVVDVRYESATLNAGIAITLVSLVGVGAAALSSLVAKDR